MFALKLLNHLCAYISIIQNFTVATSDCESEEVIVAFLAEKQRKYSYSIFHGGKSIESRQA